MRIGKTATKICFKCKCEKTVDNFCKDKNKQDKLNARCRSCCNLRSRQWRKEKPEQARAGYDKWVSLNRKRSRGIGRKWRENNSEWAKEYRALWVKNNPDYFKNNSKKWCDANPEKKKAHSIIRNAILTKKIKKLPCAKCGTATNVEGHHEDYRKPLKVIWLCRKHHREAHFNQSFATQNNTTETGGNSYFS